MTQTIPLVLDYRSRQNRIYKTENERSNKYYNDEYINHSDLMIPYHNIFRLFVGYPKRCRASVMHAENNVPSMESLIRKYICNRINRINSSSKLLNYYEYKSV